MRSHLKAHGMTIRKLVALALLVTLWAGCFRDSGIVDIDKPESLPPLARFQGRAYNEGDTTLPSNRLLELVHPTIALVYHSIGARENIRTVTAGVVATSPPFAFQIEMKQAPPLSIQNDDEVAVGLFWLFSDRNENGIFDRGTHPEYAKKLREIDSLTRLYYQRNDSLLAISEVIPEGVAAEETTWVGPHGLTLVGSKNKPDTVWPAIPGFWSKPTEAPFIRKNVLLSQGKWERFFDRRKRSNPASYTVLPNPDYSLEMVLRYSRRLFPRKGLENAFNQGVMEVGVLSLQRDALASKYQTEAFQKGWLDYPFDGFNETGADWGAGRSRDQFVFYFPTWKSIEMMKKAERSSSFQIANLDQIAPGYNLMECNDQYDCRRLGEGAEIKIYLGKSEVYFNPPSVIRPFTASIRSPGIDTVLNRSGMDLEGTYSFQPGVPFSFQKAGGSFWLDAPPFGGTQVQMVDSLRGVGVGNAMQIQFVPTEKDDMGEIGKLILDWRGSRYVAVRASSSIEAKTEEKITRHLQAAASDLSVGITESLKQPYRWLGVDTLKFSEASSQSVWLSGNGFPKQKLVAVDSTTLVSTVSDFELQWKRKPDQIEGEWFLFTGGASFRIPPVAFSGARNDSTLFHALRLVHDFQGSAKDRSMDVQGKPRFTCAEDSLYFIPGDSGFSRALPETRGDRLTVEGEGSFDLEIPLDSTSDTLGLALDFCGARSANVKGALIRVLIKGDRNSSWSEWAPSLWLSPNSSGAMAWQAVLGMPQYAGGETSTASRLWVKVENIAVPAGNSYLALNRYRLYSR